MQCPCEIGKGCYLPLCSQERPRMLRQFQHGLLRFLLKATTMVQAVRTPHLPSGQGYCWPCNPHQRVILTLPPQLTCLHPLIPILGSIGMLGIQIPAGLQLPTDHGAVIDWYVWAERDLLEKDMISSPVLGSNTENPRKTALPYTRSSENF